MKGLRFVFMIGVILMFWGQLFGTTKFDGKVILEVNGHSYAIDDMIGKAFLDAWNDSKDSLAKMMAGVWIGGYNSQVKEVHLTEPTGIEFEKNAADSTKIILKLEFKNQLINMNFGASRLARPYRLRLSFDINALLCPEMTDSGLVIACESITSENVHPRFDSKTFVGDILDNFTNIFISIWDYFKEFSIPLKDFKSKKYVIPIIHYFNESAKGIVNGVNSGTEAQRVINSFPINVSFEYYKKNIITNLRTGQYTKYKGLIIKVELLPGYYDAGGVYHSVAYWSNIPSHQNILTDGGIGSNGDPYENIRCIDYSLDTWQEQVDAVHKIIGPYGYGSISGMGLNFIRIEAFWSRIVPPITEINPQNLPDEINDSLVDAYINTISAYGIQQGGKFGWNWIDYTVQNAINNKLEPVVIIGCGHSDRPPFVSGTSNHIAPGNVRYPNPIPENQDTNYIGVPREVYLYYLELYSRAVVRHLKDKVKYWQAENELNAARFTEVYNWWRKGDAWADESVGGFQDQVAQMLYKVIKDEDNNSDTQVIQDFHVFNLGRCLAQWKGYYDIAALNFYPNELFGVPPMGFMVGELVWSARRILKSLGIPNTEVWVMETGYGVKDSSDYTRDRQVQFVKDAILSCYHNGAKCFNWFQMVTSNNSLGNNYSDINNYIGFFDNNGTERPTKEAFKQEFAISSPLAWAEFRNEDLESGELLGGTFDIPGKFTGIPSGSPLRVEKTVEYDLHTNQEILPLPSDNEMVKHKRWNKNDNEIMLNKLYKYNDDGPVQRAQFTTTEPVYFQVNLPLSEEEKQAKVREIQIKDPWYTDKCLKRKYEFVPLAESSDTSVYEVFLNQDPRYSYYHYTVKAPYIGGSDLSEIYIFDYWSGNRVDITQPQSTTTNINFLPGSGDIQLTANYKPVCQIHGFSLTIPQDEILMIYPGANISFAEGITLDVQGTLVVVGTGEQPDTLTSTGKEGNLTQHVG